jgi:hypothetical protein
VRRLALARDYVASLAGGGRFAEDRSGRLGLANVRQPRDAAKAHPSPELATARVLGGDYAGRL